MTPANAKTSPSAPYRLIADIGGTHARFALSCDGQIEGAPVVLQCREYLDIDHLVQAALVQLKPHTQPRAASFAIAAPVDGERIQLTNLAWGFTIPQLKNSLDLDALEIVNDFTAIAWAIGHLTDSDHKQIGGGTSRANSTVAIIGPGSGLGIAALIADGARHIALPTEGGHATLPASNNLEARIIGIIRRIYGHASAERILSGPGLQNLHRALQEINGVPIEDLNAESIHQRAQLSPTSHAATAIELFCDFLGTVAANTALGFNAHGGIYIAGGVVPKLGPLFDQARFRTRFESKGRFSDYVSNIPTFIITHPFPALMGLARGAK